jgi:L-alanine-DL-glutamate epimerase-like enolase superfamily enzyme
MALRNTTMFEVLLPHGAHKFGMATEIDIDEAGMMHAPTGPGLGANIDFALIERNSTAVLR